MLYRYHAPHGNTRLHGRNWSSERNIDKNSGKPGEIAIRDTPEKSTFMSDVATFNGLSKNVPPADPNHQTSTSSSHAPQSQPRT
jgi:hypothetical protein